MLDLTIIEERARLGVNDAELSCPWEDMAAQGTVPPSWTLGQRLIETGIAGILVRSFAHGATLVDINAVFWRWSDVRPHQVRVIDDFGRLPKDDASWR